MTNNNISQRPHPDLIFTYSSVCTGWTLSFVFRISLFHVCAPKQSM